MHKYIIGILAILALSFLLGCEENSNAVTQEETQQEKNVKDQKEADHKKASENAEAPFFWRVNDGDTTVYLLGSIHVGNKEMYPMDQVVEDAYESSDSVVVEADILQAPEEMFGDDFMAKAVYADGSLLSDRISEEAYDQLSVHVNDYSLEGLTMSELNHFKPWFIEILLSDFLMSEEESLTSQYGIDYHFLQRAEEDNKQILELEGVNEQFKFISEMPEDLQIKSLENSLEIMKEETGGNAIQTLIEAWQSGSEEKLASIVSGDTDASLTDLVAYETELMEKRNTKMAEKIENYLREGSGETYFVVVGAAHYLADFGLDNLLDNDFTVESYSEMN
ncbi:TraB/GumN family protein [Sediminibacillus massiliensis]|uniref:TraB/GumN family protein n=1 Tax=Sediminibacillus massiliensis TaxID=1926277 RepID=UPI00098869AB|nr:TraB/GumN family protein [Sediminibacillus massiliensis]